MGGRGRGLGRTGQSRRNCRSREGCPDVREGNRRTGEGTRAAQAIARGMCGRRRELRHSGGRRGNWEAEGGGWYTWERPMGGRTGVEEGRVPWGALRHAWMRILPLAITRGMEGRGRGFGRPDREDTRRWGGDWDALGDRERNCRSREVIGTPCTFARAIGGRGAQGDDEGNGWSGEATETPGTPGGMARALGGRGRGLVYPGLRRGLRGQGRALGRPRRSRGEWEVDREGIRTP